MPKHLTNAQASDRRETGRFRTRDRRGVAQV